VSSTKHVALHYVIFLWLPVMHFLQASIYILAFL